MSKCRDYKTADAPKAEPLKASLGDRVRIAAGTYDVKQMIADINAALVADDEKEQTP